MSGDPWLCLVILNNVQKEQVVFWPAGATAADVSFILITIIEIQSHETSRLLKKPVSTNVTCNISSR